MQKNINTELESLRLTLAGDKEAFRVIVDAYKDNVFNLIFRMCGNRHDAEDLTQEAFIKAFENLTKYDQKLPFRNWIFTIAANLCKNHIKRGKILNIISIFTGKRDPEERIELIDPPAENNNPPDILIEKEEKQRLFGIVNLLPERYKLVFMLRYVEEFSYKEIADITGFPLGTVETYIHRAKEQFLKNLKKSEITG